MAAIAADKTADLNRVRQLEEAVASGQDVLNIIAQWREASSLPDPELADYASEADCPLLLSALIEVYGVDANWAIEGASRLPYTLLCTAAENGASKSVAVLLSHGANVNATTLVEGATFTPLYFAADSGHTALCRQLLDAGADHDVRCGKMQWTALHAAASSKRVGVVALLVQRGADTHATTTNHRWTPIFFCLNGDTKEMLCLRVLLPHSDLEHVDSQGFSMLHHAAFFGRADVLEVLLPRYAAAGLVDIPLRAQESGPMLGATPLMLACHYAKYKAAKLLLQAGASRLARKFDGRTALYDCIKSSSLACLQLLLGEAPNWHYTPQQLNDTVEFEITPLGAALVVGNVSCCKLLMEAGADPADDCADVARSLWPDKPELAALIESGSAALAPPCCANCQKSGVKLSACSRCQAVRYCSTACHRAHWQHHKTECVSCEDQSARMEAALVEKIQTDERRR